MQPVLWIIAAYLAGSFPSSYILTRLFKGVDIRRHGSGNPGTTNVFRVAGPVPGVLTFILDFLKGFLPVFAAAGWFGADGTGALLAVGLAAIAGHMWTVFLNFRGGKGVATAAGVFFALLPVPTAAAIGVFALVLLTTRYVSLGSIAAAVTLPVLALASGSPAALTVFAAVVAAGVVYRHRANIRRLMNGTENRVGRKGKKA